MKGDTCNIKFKCYSSTQRQILLHELNVHFCKHPSLFLSEAFICHCFRNLSDFGEDSKLSNQNPIIARGSSWRHRSGITECAQKSGTVVYRIHAPLPTSWENWPGRSAHLSAAWHGVPSEQLVHTQADVDRVLAAHADAHLRCCASDIRECL